MGSLIVITGPPGAGKSTVARAMADRLDKSVLVHGDAFFGFLATSAIPPWLPESHDQNKIVTEAAASAAGCYASGGYETVYDGIVGPWFLDTFAAATGLTRLNYVILLPPVELCVKRVETRTDHGFDDESATRKMHDEFAASTIDAKHVLNDPPDGTGKVADLIIKAMNSGNLAHDPHPSFRR